MNDRRCARKIGRYPLFVGWEHDHLQEVNRATVCGSSVGARDGRAVISCQVSVEPVLSRAPMALTVLDKGAVEGDS